MIENGLSWLQSNQQLVLLCTVGALFVVMFWPTKTVRELGWLALTPRRRGVRMLRKARREFVDNMITYEFTSFVEDAVFKGTITREEAREVYRRMKQLFPIRNMFPHPELLKENIKKRLGKHVTPNFPDKKIVVAKKRHAFEKVTL